MDAAAAATQWHAGQRRRDGKTPYVAHCFRVAMIVRHEFACEDEDAISIALLHDVIEDTPADYDDVLEGFGKTVADGVAALSKDMRLPEPEREPAYDQQIERADWRARLVKLADTIDNLLDSHKPTSKSLEKCRRAIQLARSDERLAGPVARTRKILSEHGFDASA
jgi:(p)ppGpp synthase/HD superfamily hydrolase